MAKKQVGHEKPEKKGKRELLVRGYFTPEFKQRCVDFIEIEKIVPSLNALLIVSVEFYLESFVRSGKLLKGKFPVVSAAGELEVIIKARDGTDHEKHRANDRRI